MNAKMSVFVICVEAIIYLSLDCTFNFANVIIVNFCTVDDHVQLFPYHYLVIICFVLLLYSITFCRYPKKCQVLHLFTIQLISKVIFDFKVLTPFRFTSCISVVLSQNIRFKAGLSPSKNISFYFLQRKPFKNDEKCFLFHFERFFRSQDI